MNRDNENDRGMPSGQEPLVPAKGEAVAMVEGDADPAGTQKPGTTDVQAYIGRQLRAVYDDVVKQPIPERFLALMAQLEEQTRAE